MSGKRMQLRIGRVLADGLQDSRVQATFSFSSQMEMADVCTVY
ncbi:MAG: hypothetical protein ACI9DC_000193 [Gammaproteobacteria bacterium]|jgi:hypothetical protein